MTIQVRLLRGRWREELPGSSLRWWLAPLTLPAWACYRAGVALRNHRYDSGRSVVQRLPAPVVSVGNLTAGGTGKTPAVLAVCRQLAARGRRPAVLSRGYRGEGGANDEAHLLDGFPVVCDPDRVAGGRRALAAGADCLVLDDGFQHRRLHRDCDLVLVDATRPGDACLPLGWLREPMAGIRRARLAWISRADLVAPAALAALTRRLDALGVPWIRDHHRDGGLTPLGGGDTHPSATLAGQRVVLASGIGNPHGFEAAALLHRWQVVESLRFPDHHRYDRADARLLAEAARRHQAVLVVTAKDAVKLTALGLEATCWVLAAGDRLDGDGLAELGRVLAPLAGGAGDAP
ncbi:MAG: tetraacyldisaccharide 4'-kinase [Planctomycetes bacterium]|nr:tetraacyldisaccharide 4'-kinase [Planctomycetota bacterium]